MKNSMNINSAAIILLGLLVTPILALASSNPVVDIQTNRGLISVQLDAKKAPITVANFLRYVHEGFYANTLFHRVIDNIMIQGGGYNAELEIQAVHAPIKLETNVGLSNLRGTIAMARRSAADTASSQFFINSANNLLWDYQHLSSPGYAVFGEVIEGMAVVDAISGLPTKPVAVATAIEGEPRVLRDAPEMPVVIEVMRPREGQLSFATKQLTYQPGDRLEVALIETMKRESVLDLWVAVLTEQGQLFYVTETGFSLMPNAFVSAVAVDTENHPVFNFIVPQGLTGRFTLLAIFNKADAGIDDLKHNLRSNIAKINLNLVR